MEDKNGYQEQGEEKISDHENEIEEELDDVESELAVDENVEEFAESVTGIKFKYILAEQEIIDVFKHTENYQKNCKLQKNNTIIQGVLFVMLMFLWAFMANAYYAIISILPLACIGLIWIIPQFSLKRLAKEFYSGEEVILRVFPDKIFMEVKDTYREIPLDGTAELEEVTEMLVITPKAQNTLIIPLRAIESELLPDIQAMIKAGTAPKEEE